ncbi:hypothetical protein H072_3722 [Dactylellina haptotyla CBS 200.50]|uniref:Aminoglycoside phosphotransferase domain-containing protein n=1 Tax=Dactylellina haptotyla (strain CBS 200.50) TaxID=1284197 RepID=S8AH05_DACHA|nr:hypothetical protein H072_3722 [Dactylellina haptotyla CBS 200.50]
METPEPSSSSGSASSSSHSQSSRTTKASSAALSIGSKMTSFARKRATSVSSTSIRGQCPECRDKHQDDMGLKVNSEALIQLAQSLRKDVKAGLGQKISEALDYTVEITFEDKVSWLARIPKPWRSSHVNDSLAAQVAAWRYLRKHTSIPVPQVYHCAYDTDPSNTVGVSFMLYEKLSGRTVPELDEEDPASSDKAERFHDQLSQIILELSSCVFDKIGSLQQSPTDPEEFTVGPLYNLHNTYPLARGRAATHRGPYISIFEYFTAFGTLNYKDTKSQHHRGSHQSNDMCVPLDEELARFFLINKMIPKFSIETGFNNGPFVFQNWGLNTQNILVDDDCNITGITGIGGTIGPITSLCKYPDLIYETKRKGPLYSRKFFLSSFLTADIPESVISSGRTSPLEDKEARKALLRSAHKVWQFENSILEPSHKHLHLRGRGGLYEYVFEDTKFSEKSAFKSLGDQDPDYQHLAPKSEMKHGEYSWDLPEDKKTKRRRSSGTTNTKAKARKVWDKAPWVKSHKEEVYVREYVRVHRHLPPEVKAYDGRRRSNGPEKAFHMAWAFVRCRDASYMRRKNEKQRKVVRITGGRNRSSSVRQTGKRVRGWSLGGDSTKRMLNKGKGKAVVPTGPRVVTIQKKEEAGTKKFMGFFSKVTGSLHSSH